MNLLLIVFIIQITKLQVHSQQQQYPQNFQHLFGSKTTKLFNPNYGYEPYWADGSWVFQNKELPPGVTTTQVPMVCGEECIDIYTSIGEVCARRVDILHYHGCTPTVFAWYCSGAEIDEQSEGYRTFPTYCRFLDAQCHSELDYKWILVHRGECVTPQIHLFKPLAWREHPISRAEFDLTSLASLFDNYTIKHTILEDG
ncbi:uncharacterized protein LOC133320393 isoform X2 [Danaus plexippus]|uniref:uncharacterized protein LOC133320393 isoform X2 n=1 Tax=Danaus plexippus TaxID=13037 RepID=UPI002AAF317A|nr:uncharacterized protein LOC133320393 isoform X2 [Danaus plexippus]